MKQSVRSLCGKFPVCRIKFAKIYALKLKKRAAHCTKAHAMRGSRKGPNHKGILYSALPHISTRDRFHGLNP